MYIDIAFNPTHYKTDKNEINHVCLKKIMDNARTNDVLPIFIGSDAETSKIVYNLSIQYNTYCYVGIHPNDIPLNNNNEYNDDYNDIVEKEMDIISNLLDNDTEGRIIGIGECGIDTYRSPNNLKDQVLVFGKHLNLFKKYNLPLFLHFREDDENKCFNEFILVIEKFNNQNANTDTVLTLETQKYDVNNSDCLKDNLNINQTQIRGVVHSYTGTLDQMKRILNLGLDIGINGISIKQLLGIENIKMLPINRLHFETDSPFCLMRKKWAGFKFVQTMVKSKNNEPSYIKYVCEAVSNIKNIDFKFIMDKVFENTKKLFKIKNN